MERTHNTAGFLRMAAIELRHLADGAPEIREQLLNMAQQLEAEADELDTTPDC